MKTFLELAKNRQSDRAYADKDIEKAKLERILDAARLAPSACNAQPWKMVVVTNREKRIKIAEATSSRVLGMNHFTKQAPVQIVIIEEGANFSSNAGSLIKNKHLPCLDLGILLSYISLAAADEGLGSCILGWFNEEKIREILNIPKKKRVWAVITLGYSAQEIRNKKRKSINETVSYESYQTDHAIKK